ncbi:hypothetical protein [Roseomonas mucosa]|uniref:hypothetical protein n=1 Tax=Roseomonas mucosa TaxID=207340 RepID=UPI0011157DF5|nr:hypothetical protein [Roseomonas mucosa]
MATVTRRAALALAAGAAAGLAPAGLAAPAPAAVAPPVQYVAAVLAAHPWIFHTENRPFNPVLGWAGGPAGVLEVTALAHKLAERLGWPASAARFVVMEACRKGLGTCHRTEEIFPDIDRDIAAQLASSAPLPTDNVSAEQDARYAAYVVQRERELRAVYGQSP